MILKEIYIKKHDGEMVLLKNILDNHFYWPEDNSHLRTSFISTIIILAKKEIINKKELAEIVNCHECDIKYE